MTLSLSNPALDPTSLDTSREAEGTLMPLQIEVIELIVGATKLLGLPRSLGEIYGILFISPAAMALDELVERLQISKGSASQGLKTLRQIGAVKQTYVPGERRDYYTAETELKKLVAGFFAGQLVPHLDGGADRLREIDDRKSQLLNDSPAEQQEFYIQRLRKLSQWVRHAQQLAPMVSKLID